MRKRGILFHSAPLYFGVIMTAIPKTTNHPDAVLFCRSIFTKEELPHIVINANNSEPMFTKNVLIQNQSSLLILLL
jgi:hypothetical protein